MIFKGNRYTKSNKVVVLPQEFWDGDSKNFVAFGRICKESEPKAVKTKYFILDDAENKIYIYAVPVEGNGYSLTNLMYGKDKKMYLYLDGKVYVRTMKKKAVS